MKLRLAYENELELTNLPTFRGRVSFINSNIFNNKENMLSEKEGKIMSFEEFYNITSSVDRSEVEEMQIKDRWLGIKRVGSPHKDESMKMTLDFIATYLLNSKEYSSRSDIHELKKLQKKKVSSSIDKAEAKELERLKKNTIFYKIGSRSSDEEDIVFYFNKGYEDMLKRRVKEESLPLIENKITNCKKLRGLANQKAKKYNGIKEKILNVESGIKKYYQDLKDDRKNAELFNKIIFMVKSARRLEKELGYLEEELKILTDDYLQETELQININ